MAIIGRLELLKEQLGNITIPSAVHAELWRMPILAARNLIERAIHDRWIQVRPVTKPIPAELLLALHLGEAEAISQALESKSSLILLDETAARDKAKDLNLKYTGVLGILLRARQNGKIESLALEIQKLRAQAKFFISPRLRKLS